MSSMRSDVFGASFQGARSYSPKLRCVRKAFGRSVNSTVRTMVSLGLDGFPASATDVLRFRLLYFGYVATFYFALVLLSEASRYPLPSKS